MGTDSTYGEVTLDVQAHSFTGSSKLRLPFNGRASFRSPDGSLWAARNLGDAISLQKLSGSTGVYRFSITAGGGSIAHSPFCIWQKLQAKRLPTTPGGGNDDCGDVDIVCTHAKLIQSMFIAVAGADADSRHMSGQTAVGAAALFAKAIRPNAHRVIVSNRGISMKVVIDNDDIPAAATAAHIFGSKLPAPVAAEVYDVPVDNYTETPDKSTAVDDTEMLDKDGSSSQFRGQAAQELMDDLERLSSELNVFKGTIEILKVAAGQRHTWLVPLFDVVEMWVDETTRWGMTTQSNINHVNNDNVADYRQDLESKLLDIKTFETLVTNAQMLLNYFDGQWSDTLKTIEDYMRSVLTCKQLFVDAFEASTKLFHMIMEDYYTMPFKTHANVSEPLLTQSRTLSELHHNIQSQYVDALLVFDNSVQELTKVQIDLNQYRTTMVTIFETVSDDIQSALNVKEWPQSVDFVWNDSNAQLFTEHAQKCLDILTALYRTASASLPAYGKTRAQCVNVFAQLPTDMVTAAREWVFSWPGDDFKDVIAQMIDVASQFESTYRKFIDQYRATVPKVSGPLEDLSM